MKRFDVWLHPLNASTCRVRVDGKDNTNWLLSRLSDAYVVKTRDSIRQERDSQFYTFDVLYPQHLTHFMLEELLEKIPTINLRMGFGMSPTRDKGESV
ncbi:MAG: hypothetical protein AB7U20_07845 [Planctomycetaceae bacterium]